MADIGRKVQREPAGRTLQEEPNTATIHNSEVSAPIPQKAPTTQGGGGPKCVQTLLLVVNLVVMLYLCYVYTESELFNSSSRQCTCAGGNSSISSQSDTMEAIARKTTAAMEPSKKAPAPQAAGWTHNGTVYGFIHVAKVAGTEINGMLALNYERVCGNKGYSFDILEANKRWGEFKRNHNFTKPEDQPNDFVNKFTKQYGRTRLPFALMDERGFDDCDYIAFEDSAKRWAPLYKQYKMELHVPCRDPLSHLMSSCNFQKFIPWIRKEVVFNCSSTDLVAEVKRCAVFLDDRIHGGHMNFTTRRPNGVSIKCFNPMPPQRYVDYMGHFLQPKRIQADYIHVETNNPRDKDKECVWKQSKEWQQKLLQVMRKTHFYYRFCGECMGSQDELPLPRISQSQKQK